ncbi:MAG: hypothetical protein AB8G15_09380 [Saprospiraceae bacterium]
MKRKSITKLAKLEILTNDEQKNIKGGQDQKKKTIVENDVFI